MIGAAIAVVALVMFLAVAVPVRQAGRYMDEK